MPGTPLKGHPSIYGAFTCSERGRPPAREFMMIMTVLVQISMVQRNLSVNTVSHEFMRSPIRSRSVSWWDLFINVIDST